MVKKTALAVVTAAVLFGSSAPTFAATHKVAMGQCTAENTPAVISVGVPANFPIARLGESGRVSVQVDLSATGAVNGASIAKSSGSMFFDEAALEAAREQTYAAEVNACEPVAGSYLVQVDFEA